ncbi:hypothetical protein [Maribacter sp. ACAM166]|nr:hypothetical protein [Maribacter sp. ACAM166]
MQYTLTIWIYLKVPFTVWARISTGTMEDVNLIDVVLKKILAT